MIDIDQKRLPAWAYLALTPAAGAAIIAVGWMLDRIFQMAGG
jgi:hypothetical protein